MSKWYGLIGYETYEDDNTGVARPVITERYYYGDLNRLARRLQTDDRINSDIVLNNELSIIADAFALENFDSIRYAEFMGTKWAVSSAQVEYPRIILNFGGVYHAQQT